MVTVYGRDLVRGHGRQCHGQCQRHDQLRSDRQPQRSYRATFTYTPQDGNGLSAAAPATVSININR